jgi:hypothetical protein
MFYIFGQEYNVFSHKKTGTEVPVLNTNLIVGLIKNLIKSIGYHMRFFTPKIL